jgi:hypothetical protein
MYPKAFFDYFRDFDRTREVFVAMPFSRDAQPRWRTIFSPAIRSIGLRPFRVQEGRISDSILTDILNAISRARLILVDVSLHTHRERRPPGPNPNVMYELGIAHSTRLPEEVIVVRGDSEPAEPPFDIAHVRYHRFAATAPRRAVSQISRLLQQAQTSLDATRDLIVKQTLRRLDPDLLSFLWTVREGDSFDLASFDPDR